MSNYLMSFLYYIIHLNPLTYYVTPLNILHNGQNVKITELALNVEELVFEESICITLSQTTVYHPSLSKSVKFDSPNVFGSQTTSNQVLIQPRHFMNPTFLLRYLPARAKSLKDVPLLTKQCNDPTN